MEVLCKTLKATQHQHQHANTQGNHYQQLIRQACILVLWLSLCHRGDHSCSAPLWPQRAQRFGLNMSVMMILDEVYININPLSQADGSAWLAWASPNQLTAWLKQEGWPCLGQKREFSSLTAVDPDISLFSACKFQRGHLLLSGFPGSLACRFTLRILRFVRFHSGMQGFLIINLCTHRHTHAHTYILLVLFS